MKRSATEDHIELCFTHQECVVLDEQLAVGVAEVERDTRFVRAACAARQRAQRDKKD